jgi:Mg2+-importing ATPase
MMMGSIFAMAGGVLLQPFLPMRPKQRPLNGLLYALPQTTIPPDWMYDEMIRSRAAGASTSFASSCSYADPLALSSTSLHSVFCSRSYEPMRRCVKLAVSLDELSRPKFCDLDSPHGSFLRDPPHPALVARALLAFFVAVVLPYSPLSHWLGFVSPPAASWARSQY